MKRLLIFVLVLIICLLCISCNSIMSKFNSSVKADAESFVSTGKYRVIETSTISPKDSGRGTSDPSCMCNQKLWLYVQPISSSSSNNKRLLCLGKDHEKLVDFAALRQGDTVSFESTENMLDAECNGNPSTFLKIKK